MNASSDSMLVRAASSAARLVVEVENEVADDEDEDEDEASGALVSWAAARLSCLPSAASRSRSACHA